MHCSDRQQSLNQLQQYTYGHRYCGHHESAGSTVLQQVLKLHVRQREGSCTSGSGRELYVRQREGSCTSGGGRELYVRKRGGSCTSGSGREDLVDEVLEEATGGVMTSGSERDT